MITLTGKTTNYSVTNETEGFKLQGVVTMTEDDLRISSFSGSFSKTNGDYSGSFYYSENEMGKASKNINDVATEDALALDNFFDLTITELKALNDDNE